MYYLYVQDKKKYMILYIYFKCTQNNHENEVHSPIAPS
jgi:hypothetical protein